MTATVDFSYIAADSLRRVATLDLDTGAVTDISAPGPALPFAGGFDDSFAPGCRLPDGRTAFPASDSGSSNVALHVLSADRSSWSITVTSLTNAIDDPIPIQRPDGGVFISYARLGVVTPFLTQAFDPDTGAALTAEVGPYTPPNISGVDVLQALTAVDSTSLALAATQDAELWSVDVTTSAGLTTVATVPPVGRPDLSPWAMSAPALHTVRSTVFAYSFDFFSGGWHVLIAEVDYATGALVNSTIVDVVPPIGRDANGAISDHYYALVNAGAAGVVGRFDIATGMFDTVAPAVPGAFTNPWLVPNTGVPPSGAVPSVRQRQIPGQVRQRQIPGQVRQRQDWR